MFTNSISVGYHKSIMVFFMGVSALLAGCASSTQISGSWKSPDVTSPEYDDVFIVALIRDIDTRETLEGELAAQLENQGIRVTKSTEVFTPNFTEDLLEDKELILQKVRDHGSEAILTISVVDEETETRFVPGNITYNPTLRFSFYDNFWSYYTHYYPQVYDPGYYTKDRIYFLETNLYDTETENLVWSAQSRSYNPEDTEIFSEEFSQVTIKEMKDDHLINVAG